MKKVDSFWELFREHRGKIIGGILGLFIGIIIILFGFFKTLFVILCAIIGYYIGKSTDSKNGLRDLLDKILPPGNRWGVPFLSRKIAREQAFKILFAIDVGDNSVEEAADIVIPFLKDENQKSFILKEVYGVIENLSQIDKLIEKYSNEWSIERMAATDRNILRISVYEMIFCKEIPVSVSINEAVEISKKYCEEMSYKFINGLLGSIAKDYSLSSKNPWFVSLSFNI